MHFRAKEEGSEDPEEDGASAEHVECRFDAKRQHRAKK